VSINNYSNYDLSNVMIQRCTFYNGYHTTGPDIDAGTSTSGDLTNVTVRYCLIYDDPNRKVGWGVNSVFVQGPHGGSGAVYDFNFYCNIIKYPHGNAVSLERVYGAHLYNNTFYGHNPNWTPSYSFYADTYCTDVELKNNIFYTTLPNESQGNGAGFVTYAMSDSEVDADYNLYYRTSNSLRIALLNGSSYYMNTLSSMRTQKGYEMHSPTPADPLFISATDYHLQAGSPAIGKGVSIPEVTMDFEGKPINNPPDIGSFAASGTTPVLSYVSSVIENAAPSVLEMTYNMSLANIVPASSAFTVMVNSVQRTVSSVAVSGTKVRLTLASPVVNGNVVTVAYTKPATNPLQTVSGIKAESLSSVTVANNCNPPAEKAPAVYITSPLPNSRYRAPATITFRSSATDEDGPVVKVEYFNGNVKLGERTSSPYRFSWYNVPGGNYFITAVATDNSGLKTVSDPLPVIVYSRLTPSISIASPESEIQYSAPATIEVKVDYYDPDTTIAKIEYFKGTTKIGESLEAPYAFSFEVSDTGSFEIIAVASDDIEVLSETSAVKVNVTSPDEINPDLIRLYPNPNRGNFTIEILTSLEDEINTLTVVNLAGETVYETILPKDETIRHFDLPHLFSGVYFIIVKNNRIVLTRKFIKK
jgi:uncharacterized repeat protein (TIGR02059 family)